MYSLDTPDKRVGLLSKLKKLLRKDRSRLQRDSLSSNQLDHELLFGYLSQLVCVKDIEGKYVLANQSFCDLTGLSAGEIIGQDDEDLGLFLNPEQIMEADRNVITTGQKKHIPIEPFTDKYGSLYWFKTDKIPLKDANGDITKVLLISIDITKDVEKQQRLQQSELRYKSIFENNYSGIIVTDVKLAIYKKNLAFNRLVKSRDTSLEDDDLKHYITSQDEKELKDLMSGLASRNYEYFDLEMDLISTEEKVINTKCFVRGIYDDNGGFREAVVTFQDTTEDQLKNRALEESEKRFRVIVENATEALLLLDYNTRKYIDVNKNAVELFGYQREELLSLALGDLSPMNQNDGSDSKIASTDQMRRALNGENVTYEWVVKRKDNKLIPCEVRLVKLPYKGSSIIRTSVIDITERKRAERMLNLEKLKLESKNEELQELNDALENQTKQLQEFAYISSHNLRSPAGNIRALLDFYTSDPSEENLDLLLTKLDTVSIDLLDTINDLAEVVKIKNEFAQETTDISLLKTILKTKDSLSQMIENKEVHIDLELNGIDLLRTSKTYMESVLLNLISNALKYAHPERHPEIKITASIEKDDLRISVKDNGLGIDLKKYGKKIFGLRKTFHRNKDSRGVGLFITKAQVEALKGSISVESKPNEGSIFTITLPSKIVK